MPSFCDKCGNELKDENVKFCDKCGAEIKLNQNKNNSETVSGIVCPKCGQTTPMGQTVCSNCGAEIYMENNTAAVVAGYFTLWILPIISLIIGIYLLTRKNSKSKTQGILLIVIMILYVIVSAIVGDFVYTFNDIILKYIAVPLIGTVIGAITWFKDITIIK